LTVVRDICLVNDGIEASDDPILAVRRGIYEVPGRIGSYVTISISSILVILDMLVVIPSTKTTKDRKLK